MSLLQRMFEKEFILELLSLIIYFFVSAEFLTLFLMSRMDGLGYTVVTCTRVTQVWSYEHVFLS